MQVTREEYSLLERLAKEMEYPCLDPEKHVTAKMLSDATGLGIKRCLDILNEKLAKGELKREWVRQDNGKPCYLSLIHI